MAVKPDSHYNIQINIQEVTPSYDDDTSRRPVTGERKSIPKDSKEILSVKVVADTLPEAVRKAQTILSVSGPAAEAVAHVHRASCDDAGGNHICGE